MAKKKRRKRRDIDHIIQRRNSPRKPEQWFVSFRDMIYLCLLNYRPYCGVDLAAEFSYVMNAKIPPKGVYSNLHRLRDRGLIERIPPRMVGTLKLVDGPSDRVRKFYRTTALGRKKLDHLYRMLTSSVGSSEEMTVAA